MDADVNALKSMVEKHVTEQYPDAALSVSIDWRGIATVSGQCSSYQQLVDVGHSVAKLPGIRNVVSEMHVKGMELPHRDYSSLIEQGHAAGELANCDVVVVGLGIVGAACARELARYNLNIIAIDIAEDIATGASKANNGGVHHAGGVKPGTLKAKLSVQGNRMWDRLAEELGFDFDRCGDLLYIEDPDDMDELADEFKTAVRNGDYKPKLIDGEQCFEIEPKLADYGKSLSWVFGFPAKVESTPMKWQWH